MPDLLDLVEEVATTKTPRKLKRDDKIVAVLSPVFEEEKRTTKLTADQQKSLAAIGSWRDLNADELLETIARWREAGSRPLTRP